MESAQWRPSWYNAPVAPSKAGHAMNRRRLSLIGIIVLGIGALIFGAAYWTLAQGQRGAGAKVLYVVEFLRSGKSDAWADRLLRLTLRPDRTLGHETVLTTKRGFFGDPALARIVDGRYIVTEHGGVIDANEGRILLDETQGYLRGVEKALVVYRLYDPSSPSHPGLQPPGRAEQFGVFAFNLETRTRARPEAKHWYLEGIVSPDRTRSITQSSWDDLYLNHKKLAEGKRVTASKYARHGQFELHRPVLWLDNEHILTQEANGKLISIDVEGRQERVCDIDGVPPVLDAPRLWRDPKGRIIYSCGRSEHVIDVVRKTAAPLEEYALGHSFETTVETEASGAREFFFEGQRLGGGVVAVANVRTAPEVIAIWELGYRDLPRGPRVLWTKLGAQWHSIDLDYGGIIGWVE
jgi:hypothetical protein